VQPPVRPAVVVLACTVLALTAAGLGLLVIFSGLAPWNGVAACLIVLALATGCTGGAYLRRHNGSRIDPIH
jgi:hypothetical protein